MIEAAKLEADIYPAGPRGLSAYEIYKKEGGQLSEEEWLKSLNGLTPTIGENGNWFLGTVDTGLPSRGPKGDTGSIKFIVVTDLPTENIDTDAIYIKPTQDPQEQNTYEEFIYVNNAWESLGTPKVEVDLSNYPTKDEVKEITGELTDLSTEDKSNLVNAINEVASSGGDGSNTVFFHNSSITKSTMQEVYNTMKTGKNCIISIGFRNKVDVGDTPMLFFSPNVSDLDLETYSGSLFFFTPIVYRVGSAFNGQGIENQVTRYYIKITVENGNVTVVSNVTVSQSNNNSNNNSVPVLGTNNLVSYTPTSDYHPATKKYVDDSLKSFVPTPEVYIVVNENSLGQMTITNKTALETVSNAINQIKNNKGAIILFTFGSITRATYIGVIQPHNLTDTDVVIDLINSTSMYGNYYDIRVKGTTTNNVFTATKLEINQWNSSVAGVGQVLTKTNKEKYTPTGDYNPSTKLYTDKTHYENMAGYDATKTQVLKNINGTLTWVDEV